MRNTQDTGAVNRSLIVFVAVASTLFELLVTLCTILS